MERGFVGDGFLEGALVGAAFAPAGGDDGVLVDSWEDSRKIGCMTCLCERGGVRGRGVLRMR